MSEILEVISDYKKQECFMNFDKYHELTANLDDFLPELVGISTKQKWSTWGRTYIEVSPEVLSRFGVTSNLPLVGYLNLIYRNSYYFLYPGKIFEGDAGWFDLYEELNENEIRSSASYKAIKSALENQKVDADMSSEESFLSFFNDAEDKWKEVPIQNPELAKWAKLTNSHLK